MNICSQITNAFRNCTGAGSSGSSAGSLRAPDGVDLSRAVASASEGANTFTRTNHDLRVVANGANWSTVESKLLSELMNELSTDETKLRDQLRVDVARLENQEIGMTEGECQEIEERILGLRALQGEKVKVENKPSSLHRVRDISVAAEGGSSEHSVESENGEPIYPISEEVQASREIDPKLQRQFSKFRKAVYIEKISRNALRGALKMLQQEAMGRHRIQRLETLGVSSYKKTAIELAFGNWKKDYHKERVLRSRVVRRLEKLLLSERASGARLSRLKKDVEVVAASPRFRIFVGGLGWKQNFYLFGKWLTNIQALKVERANLKTEIEGRMALPVTDKERLRPVQVAGYLRDQAVKQKAFKRLEKHAHIVAKRALNRERSDRLSKIEEFKRPLVIEALGYEQQLRRAFNWLIKVHQAPMEYRLKLIGRKNFETKKLDQGFYQWRDIAYRLLVKENSEKTQAREAQAEAERSLHCLRSCLPKEQTGLSKVQTVLLNRIRNHMLEQGALVGKSVSSPLVSEGNSVSSRGGVAASIISSNTGSTPIIEEVPAGAP